MMKVTPQLGNLIKKLLLAIYGCIHISHAENITCLLCIFVHCAPVLSCSRPSIRPMGGGMHLLIDG